jgi:hypothetical protein
MFDSPVDSYPVVVEDFSPKNVAAIDQVEVRSRISGTMALSAVTSIIAS